MGIGIAFAGGGIRGIAHVGVLKALEENNIKLDNPQVSLFMIIELVSSTCFTSILYSEPLPIKEYKPFLHKEIKKILQN